MPSSAMLGLVALVRTDVSEERSASVIRLPRTGELGTTLTITSNRRAMRRNTKFSYEGFEFSHGGDYEEWRLLGCYAVWLL
jgi:hypothetical protein